MEEDCLFACWGGAAEVGVFLTRVYDAGLRSIGVRNTQKFTSLAQPVVTPIETAVGTTVAPPLVLTLGGCFGDPCSDPVAPPLVLSCADWTKFLYNNE